eukprot:Filipodium_phascolosomae@DN224_c0_g1_i1.p1
MYESTKTKLQETISTLQNQLKEANAKLSVAQQGHTAEKNKILADKVDLEKQNNSLQQKDSYYKCELRKQEREIRRLQEAFRKKIEGPDTNQKAGIEISEVIRMHESGKTTKRRSRWEDSPQSNTFENLADTAFQNREQDLLNEIRMLQIRNSTIGGSLVPPP